MVLYIFTLVLSYLTLRVAAQENDPFSPEASNFFASYSQARPQVEQQNYGAPVPAAVQTKRTYEVKPYVLNSQPPIPSVVDVQPSEQPVQVVFRTQSSPVMVQQIHTPSTAPVVERTNSEDEPHRVVHEVMRPVIQQVREIIQPFRHVSQEIRPVMEEVHTVVAKGQKAKHQLNPFENQYNPMERFTPVMMGVNENNLPGSYHGHEYGQMALANEMVGQSVLSPNGIDLNQSSMAGGPHPQLGGGPSKDSPGGPPMQQFTANQLLELYMSAHDRPLVAKAFKLSNSVQKPHKRRMKSRMSPKSPLSSMN